MSARRLAVAVGLVVLSVLAGTGLLRGPDPAPGRLAALAPAAGPTGGAASPRRNLAPRPDFPRICSADGDSSPACRRAELAAIEHAHRVEHVRPMVLPRGFFALPAADQLFVATDLERLDRGLVPALGTVRVLDRDAVSAARRGRDPVLTGWRLPGGGRVRSWGSVWAGDFGPLAAVYDWLYRDGWGGSRAGTENLACTGPHAPGCWGHRRVLLGRYPGAAWLVAGVGASAGGYRRGFSSDAELLVAATGRRPALVYRFPTRRDSR